MTSEQATGLKNVFPGRAKVYVYLPEEGYVAAGGLEYHPETDTASFRYGDRYVQRPDAVPIDPLRMEMVAGRVYESGRDRATGKGYGVHTAFRDSAPDRFGRKLLSIHAGRSAAGLSEFEILTASFTPDRMGGLAFGPWDSAVPANLAAWAPPPARAFTLDDLSRIAPIIRKTTLSMDDEEELERLREEFGRDPFAMAVTSLYSAGGARPKLPLTHARVKYLAKFPKPDDPWSEPVIEHATLALARLCGLDCPRSFVHSVESDDAGGQVQVLMVERFDRFAGTPRHIVSGFTIQGVRETDDDWGSYQDIATALRKLGDAEGPRELFRRMVFNVLVGNTDDHPRNHAVRVLGPSAARLTPVFDIVPQFRPNVGGHAMRIGRRGRESSLENALSSSEPFGMSRSQADKVVHDMAQICKGWEDVFASEGVPAHDIGLLGERMML